MVAQCPQCGRFLAAVVATIRGEEVIERVVGTCHRHGQVEAEGDCWWEDFFGWPPSAMLP